MNRSIIARLALSLVLIAGTASLPAAAGAQTYSYQYGSGYGASCPTVTRTLSLGMRGTDVTSLQSFLIAQNYPGSGSWMQTGYFGAATQAAVRIYQAQHGLSQTGYLDATTRAAILNSCGSSIGYTNPFYPTNPTYPTYPSYPTYGSLSITSISPSTALPGTSVTIYGTGFQYGSIVHIGSSNVSATSLSSNAITFVVPSIASGSYQIYVTTGSASSNSLTFAISGSTGCAYGSYGYSYGNTCGCSGTNYYDGYNNYYNYGCQNLQRATISYLSPSSGTTGSLVTIYGSGFSSSNNTVYFGGGVLTNLSSNNGTSLSFTVPTQLSGYSSQLVVPGTYNVSVANSQGSVSNTVTYAVTGNTNAAPTISNVNGPTNTTTGVQNSWTIQVNNPSAAYITTSVSWGDTGNGYVNQAAPQTTSVQGISTLSFTHTYYTSGTYTITFTVSNQYGQTNTLTQTVYVSGNGQTGGSPTLSYVSPTSGRVGTQIVLSGNNFTTDNTVRFGAGGTQHVYAYNGTTIYYTIPSSMSPCDVTVSGGYCAQYLQQVTPGSYPIFITNANGTTNTIYFNVTQ